MTAEYSLLESVIDYRFPKLSEVRYTQEGIEAIVEKGGVTYPITVTPSFGPEIVNPALDDAVALAYGQRLPAPNPNAPVSLLVGWHANGRCGANCKGCVFSNNRVGNAMSGESRNMSLARPVDPKTMAEIIGFGKKLIYERGLVQLGQTIRLNALLSGDPSYTPYVREIIAMVTQDPEISASRWSTIAAQTSKNPLLAFVDTAASYDESARSSDIVSAHKPRFQVSLHSTDMEARLQHVGHYNNGIFPPGLSPMSDIAAAFYHIKESTGYSSTVSFVLHADSVIDARELRSQIPPDVTYVCVRPIIPTDDDSTHPMPVETFKRLYSDLQDEGYIVVVMPPIGLEMDNIHAKQLHREAVQI